MDPLTTAVRADVIEVAMPLVRPFSAAHGTMSHRNAVLVRIVDSDGTEGWGECGADITPYSAPETPATAFEHLTKDLLPALLSGASLPRDPNQPMAHFAVDAAVADWSARRAGVPLCEWLGGTLRPVPVGAVVSLYDDLGHTYAEASSYLEQGYRRVKLKVEPNRAWPIVAAMRNSWPNAALAVDCNGSFSADSTAELLALDEFGLSFIEQPFRADDLAAHASLSEMVATPICLDESVLSLAAARTIIEMRAADMLTVKAARLGSRSEALSVHDLALESGIPLWCGGLLETGIGRAHAVALSTLPGFTEPADLSASARYFAHDIVEPAWVIDQGRLVPSSRPGTGVDIRLDVLAGYTIRSTTLGG